MVSYSSNKWSHRLISRNILYKKIHDKILTGDVLIEKIEKIREFKNTDKKTQQTLKGTLPFLVGGVFAIGKTAKIENMSVMTTLIYDIDDLDQFGLKNDTLADTVTGETTVNIKCTGTDYDTGETTVNIKCTDYDYDFYLTRKTDIEVMGDISRYCELNESKKDEILKKLKDLRENARENAPKSVSDTILDEIKACPHVYAAFKSPSGTGYKILMEIDDYIEKITPSEWAEFYRKAAHFLPPRHVLSISENVLCPTFNINRLCYLSYDPDAYYNPDSVKISYENTMKIPDDIKFKCAHDVPPREENRTRATKIDTMKTADEIFRLMGPGNFHNPMCIIGGKLISTGWDPQDAFNFIMRRVVNIDPNCGTLKRHERMCELKKIIDDFANKKEAEILQLKDAIGTSLHTGLLEEVKSESSGAVPVDNVDNSEINIDDFFIEYEMKFLLTSADSETSRDGVGYFGNVLLWGARQEAGKTVVIMDVIRQALRSDATVMSRFKVATGSNFFYINADIPGMEFNQKFILNFGLGNYDKNRLRIFHTLDKEINGNMSSKNRHKILMTILKTAVSQNFNVIVMDNLTSIYGGQLNWGPHSQVGTVQILKDLQIFAIKNNICIILVLHTKKAAARTLDIPSEIQDEDVLGPATRIVSQAVGMWPCYDTMEYTEKKERKNKDGSIGTSERTRTCYLPRYGSGCIKGIKNIGLLRGQKNYLEYEVVNTENPRYVRYLPYTDFIKKPEEFDKSRHKSDSIIQTLLSCEGPGEYLLEYICYKTGLSLTKVVDFFKSSHFSNIKVDTTEMWNKTKVMVTGPFKKDIDIETNKIEILDM